MLHPSDRELLLTALRPGDNQARTKFLGAARPEEWQETLCLARQHSIAPYFYWQLKSLGLENVPADVLHALRTEYLLNTQRNMRLYHELAAILGTFHRESIPVIPLKGAYLA